MDYLGTIDPATGLAVHPAQLKPRKETNIHKLLWEQGHPVAFTQDMPPAPGYVRDFRTGMWVKGPDLKREEAALQQEKFSLQKDMQAGTDSEKKTHSTGSGTTNFVPLALGAAAAAYFALK